MPQGSRVSASGPTVRLPRQPSAGAEHPAAHLRALGRRPRKRLSQSFLADAAIARAIVAAAELSPRDEVLEVGPGLGALTRLLLQQARRVVAVELDPALAADLQTRLSTEQTRFQVVQQDILRFDPAAAFAEPYVVVANLPYHVTSPTLRHLLSAGPPFACRLVVMVQREVAERLVAPAGQLSALGALIQAQARVSVVRHVPPGAFYPPPEVVSTVVRLDPLPDAERPIPRHHVPAFEAFLHAGFAQPRKQLRNSLAQGLGRDRGEVAGWLRSRGFDPARRPQELAMAEWATLFEAAEHG